MNTNFSKFIAILVVAIVPFIVGCRPTRPEIIKQNPAFAEHVAGYTSGMISRKSSIRVELENFVGDTTNINENTLPDSSLLKDIFSFEPAIAGHAIWINARTIEFIPDEALPVNQFYTAAFDLDRVAKVKRELSTFTFQFASFQQKMYVNTYGLENYDYYNLEWQYVNGRIKTTDETDTANLRKTITATQDGKQLPIRILEGYNDNEYQFVVDSVERRRSKSEVVILWNGKEIGSSSRGKINLDVSPLGDFTVQDAKVVDVMDQSIELTFSEPLLANQNLKGIITLQDVDNISFKINYNTVTVFLPNRLLGDKFLNISNGIKNLRGYNMLQEYQTTVTFEEPKPMVRIIGNGSILPNSSGLIFPFEAVSLKAIDVRVIKIYENNIHHFLQVNNLDGDDGLTRFGKVILRKKIDLTYDKTMDLKKWNKHVIDLGKLIDPDPGAIYRISIKFTKKYALCDCEAETEENNANQTNEDNEDENWSEKLWDSYGFDDGFDSWEDYSDDDSPCSNDYYYGKAQSRNILASDIGLIYKLDESKLTHVFANNMLTTDPMQNVEIQYYSFSKQIIASGKTDVNGMLEIQLKEKPFLLVAKNGKQRAYLKLADGYANSLSKFDIEGEQVQKGIKGFIYAERGVWRPGDSLFTAFILENKDNLLPSNHPVKFDLTDPNGSLVQTMTTTKHLNGVYDFRTATSSAAITGNYTATVSVGNRRYTKNIKIETIKPNRLKIYLNMDKVQARDSFADLRVQWLHGAIARNLKAAVSVSVSAKKTTFDAYKNYSFDSPVRYFASNEESIFEGKINNLGEAKIKTVLNVGQNAPGMLRATYTTKVFEESGDFSIDRCTKSYSPFQTYVGIQIPTSKSADKSLETGKNYKLNIVCLNDEGKLKNTARLQVKVYRMEWRWWYQQTEEDLSNFMSRNGTLVIKDTIIAAADGKALFPFRVDYPDYGRFMVTVTDLEGNHQTGEIVTVDWPYLSRGNRTNNENANMLNFTSDKEKYTLGDKVKLSIPSSGAGRALISIETRSKVLKKYWIATQKGETIHELLATKDMAPNAFVHVTLIQPHANTKNDLPIRMYGVIPLLVDDPATHITPQITMKDEIRPESSVSIKVDEQAGKAMTYTLAIVDEGLLDLTRFATPDAWGSFYAKEALGVKTWDMYDQVIGAYGGKLDKLLSIGGDGEVNLGKGNKANRFKPMVKFVGVFTIAAGESKTHKVQIPNYIGSVRVMVVARHEAAYGLAEKTVAVKKPLMILTTLPRVLGPTEQVAMPVTIFAMEKSIKDVKVEIEVNDYFSITGKSTQTIHFDEIGDQVINFSMLVANKVGVAKVKIKASCGNETATDEIELDVRAPNPVMYETKEITIEPGKEAKTNLAFTGISGTNLATLECSTTPIIGLEKRLNYLIEYPHGCIEQTTSAVFPQLLMSNLVETTEKQQAKINANVKAGIKRIQMFQTSNGGFSYWPGESSESDWGTNYAGHFLIEAEARGYNIPSNLKNNWIKYQKEQAKNWSNSNNVFTHAQGNASYELIQAYRLYTLALCNNAELGAMNRLREEKNVSAVAKWRLAAAYELVGQHEIAEKLIYKLSTTVSDYRELSYSYGSKARDQAMLIESLSILGKKDKAAPIVKELSKTMSSNTWMSTQETAYSLLAFCQYTGAKAGTTALSFTMKLNESLPLNKTTTKSMYQVKIGENEMGKKGLVTIKNNGKTTLFVKVLIEGVPLVGSKTSSSNGLNINVRYEDMNGAEIKPDKLIQGKEFEAIVTITNPTKSYYTEMVLNQMFPSAWEIHNNRMDDTEESTTMTRYQDIRDDRVYSYYDIAPGETKTVTIKLNAVYLGKYYLPSLYSEAMYDHSISASLPGKWVEVTRE